MGEGGNPQKNVIPVGRSIRRINGNPGFTGASTKKPWIPAFAGMTGKGVLSATVAVDYLRRRRINMPKLKTSRGAAKRFRKTGTGKIKVKRAFARHILTKKSTHRKRVLRSPKLLEKSDKRIEKLIPYL